MLKYHPCPRAPGKKYPTLGPCLEPPSGLGACGPLALGRLQAGPSGGVFFPESLGQGWYFVSESHEKGGVLEMFKYRVALYPNITLYLARLLPHLISDTGNEFFRPGFYVKWFFGHKVEYPQRT